MLKFIFTLFIFLSFNSLASATVSCTKDIYSKKIIYSIEKNLKKSLNQKASPYDWGIEFGENDVPKICSGNSNSITVLITVEVNRWNTEGLYDEGITDDCYMDLEKQNKEWKPTKLLCSYLRLEKTTYFTV